ncbi:hypothetical protein F7R06_30455 [Pseudomonas moorei]|nr:hypothetical protein F7R06_30455 [Pseudomonas moorei]
MLRDQPTDKFRKVCSTNGRGYRIHISPSSVLKRSSHQSVFWPFQETDFFNRVGHKQSADSLYWGSFRSAATVQ